MINDLIFYPPAVTTQKQWYRFFTCGLIHADAGHLIFNMLSFYFFGEMVENAFRGFFTDGGRWLYLLMYVSALFVSLLPTYLRHRDDYSYRSLGASGAVSAVLFAGLVLQPTAKIYMFFIPIGIPGFIFGPLYLLLTAYLDKRGGGNINHSAHLWGALYGLVFVFAVGYAAGQDVLGTFISSVRQYLGG
jgi:membrane associated rhomboid family serine protease